MILVGTVTPAVKVLVFITKVPRTYSNAATYNLDESSECISICVKRTPVTGAVKVGIANVFGCLVEVA